MRELLAGLVPGLPRGRRRRIVARADGIPLYAVETVRMLLADGRLERADGVFGRSASSATLAVPETLTRLIASRLDALDADDRALVQDAAVLGQSFTLAALAAVSASQPADLEPRLRALVRRELLRVEADPRSPERGQYALRPGLIREVAYGTLAMRDRRGRTSPPRAISSRSAMTSSASWPVTTLRPSGPPRRPRGRGAGDPGEDRAAGGGRSGDRPRFSAPRGGEIPGAGNRGHRQRRGSRGPAGGCRKAA